MGKLFITGIDTDIGKTYVCGALAKTLLEAGSHVYTQKLVETGCENGVSNDLLLHRKIVGVDFNTSDLSRHCPYTFQLPASPHLSAELEGIEIDPHILSRQMEELATQCEHLLIEGAGGLCVPLTKQYTIADFIVENNLPIVLVTSGRLGSINHTMLSLAFCQHRNINVKAVIYNHYGDTSDEIFLNTQETLQYYLHENMKSVEWLELERDASIIEMTDLQLQHIMK